MPSAAVSLLALLLSATSPSGPQGMIPVQGLILDTSGAPVPGATITVELDGVTQATLSSAADGRFTLAIPAEASIVLTVKAPGFAVARSAIDGRQLRVVVVVQPAGLQESVSVTATRGTAGLASPASTSTVTSAELTNTAAGAVDDMLRNTAGFGLTRRSSSRVANPSTQGVSLRGLPGNAGSRTLVLADGLPLNDPFGGWVYWNRIPEAAVERIEIMRGAAGDLYGGDAVSGVIQLLTFGPAQSQLRGSVDLGSAGTSRGSLFGSRRKGPWHGAAAGEWVRTDGVPVVAASERGKVDVNATSRYRTGFMTGGYGAARWRGRVRAAAYREDRGNGTPLVINRTDWHQLSGDLTAQLAGGTAIVQASSGRQDYYNNFSSVPPGRATERVTSEQWLPSTFSSASGQWSRIFARHVLLIGGEHKRTEAEVDEYRFALNGTRAGPFVTGGRETVSSVYGRSAFSAGDRVSIVAGARADIWRSSPRETGGPHAIDFFSPRVSVNWQVHPAIAIRASAARAYRTPTLDELHRSSQVGNTRTLGNPELDPERLTSAEVGVLFTGPRAAGRVTGFVNHLNDAITNVTVTTTPSLITRQKKNSDTVRAQGVEMEGEYRPHRSLMVSGSLVLTSSRYRDVSSLPALEGHRLPQIPFYQAAIAATYANPRVAVVAAQIRTAGMQYEDDLNVLEIAPFRVVDLSVTRSLGRGIQAYLAVENLFDEEIQTGRTPVTKIGWPRTARVGLRFVLP